MTQGGERVASNHLNPPCARVRHVRFAQVSVAMSSIDELEQLLAAANAFGDSINLLRWFGFSAKLHAGAVRNRLPVMRIVVDRRLSRASVARAAAIVLPGLCDAVAALLTGGRSACHSGRVPCVPSHVRRVRRW